jgi:acylphosphatase
MNERMEAIISGKVQGVWFRDFVVRQAQALGLTGITRNLPDGTVHVVAEGPRKDLDLLLKHLKEGPELANVTGVTHSCVPAKGEHKDFCIV